MAAALNQFNFISAGYDQMVRLIYGATLHDAQCHFIADIPDKSRVLIMGGGSGLFLKELLTRKPTIAVIYIDASSNMIEMARVKVANDPRVVFIHGTQNSIPQDLEVNTVITPFFLDLFSNHSLKNVIEQLKSPLVRNGIWIATDFTTPKKFSHRVLLWLMYRFFRLTTNIESKELPAWEACLSNVGNEIDAALFKDGFVKTAVYKINE